MVDLTTMARSCTPILWPGNFIKDDGHFQENLSVITVIIGYASQKNIYSRITHEGTVKMPPLKTGFLVVNESYRFMSEI